MEFLRSYVLIDMSTNTIVAFLNSKQNAQEVMERYKNNNPYRVYRIYCEN